MTGQSVARTSMLAWFCGEEGEKNSLAPWPVGMTCSMMK